MAKSLEALDLAQELRSVPSIVSGQMPIVLKLSRQDCVAHSTSRREDGFDTCRQTGTFPDEENFGHEINLLVINGLINSTYNMRARSLQKCIGCNWSLRTSPCELHWL